MSKLKTKNKLLHSVLGKLISSKNDKEVLPKPAYLQNTKDLWNEFFAMFSKQGLGEKMSKGSFFKAALEKMWKRNPNKFCKEGQTTEECQADTLVDMLSSVMYNKDNGVKN